MQAVQWMRRTMLALALFTGIGAAVSAYAEARADQAAELAQLFADADEAALVLFAW